MWTSSGDPTQHRNLKQAIYSSLSYLVLSAFKDSDMSCNLSVLASL